MFALKLNDAILDFMMSIFINWYTVYILGFLTYLIDNQNSEILAINQFAS